MSSHCVYVLLKSDQTRIYHNKYTAQFLDQYLLDGPDRFISDFSNGTLRGIDDLNLIHVAEGFVFIETERKRISFDGGELFTRFDPDHRRLWIEILAQVWQDWEVKYLYDNHALARELDLEYGLRRNENAQTLWRNEKWWEITAAPSYSVISKKDQQYNFCLTGLPCDYLVYRGLELLDSKADWQKSIELDQEPNSVLHLDVESKELFYWQLQSRDGLQNDFQQNFKGWAIHHLSDNTDYEEMLTPYLEVPRKTHGELAQEVLALQDKLTPRHKTNLISALKNLNIATK